MKVKNSKAFTMVELLGAITILGILMSVAVFSISRVIDNAKREYYENQNDNIALAAQSFVQNNTNMLPKNIGQKVKLKLSELVKNKYLKDKVKDYGKNDCDMDKSYVEIVKITKQDYAYNVVLKCPTYDSLKDPAVEEKTPTISITFDKEPSAKATIKMEGNDRIISYNYVVYFRKSTSESYREVKNTGSVSVNSKSSLSLDVKLDDYIPGQIKIQVSVTNSFGKTKNANASKSYMDSKPPKCVYGKFKYVKGAKDHLAWVNTSRKVTIGCTDGESGCEKDLYTQTFSKDEEFDVITIKDKSGNTTDCKVQVYVDKTPPTCTSSGGSTKWAKKLTLVGNCKDNLSGCVDKNVSGRTYKDGSVKWEIKTNMKQDKVSPGTVYDNAGNSTVCPADQTVMVDSVKPTIKVVNPPDENKWTNQNIVLTLNSSDDFSGIAYHQYRYKERENKDWTTYSDSAKPVFNTTPFSKERNEHAFLRVCDNAGNCAETTAMIKIDKSQPTCGTVTGGSTSWSNGVRNISLKCNDVAGYKYATPSECVENPYNRKYSGSSQTEKITIADNAGNSNVCTVNVYLDNTPPACPSITASVSPRVWQKNNVTFNFGFASDVAKYKWYTRTGTGSWVDWGENAPSVTSKTISGDGDRTVAVEVYDKYGNKNFCDFSQNHYYIDTKGPVCGNNTGSKSWKKGTVNMKVNCSDAGSGCTKSTFEKTFSSSETLTTGYIQISDNLGNTTSCPIDVYLDNKAPTCGRTYGDKTYWTNGDLYVQVECSDSDSKCSQSPFSKHFDSSQTLQTGEIKIKDNAGNTTNCPVNVYLDNTAPSCPPVTVKNLYNNSTVTGSAYSREGFSLKYDFGSDVYNAVFYIKRYSRYYSSSSYGDRFYNYYGSNTVILDYDTDRVSVGVLVTDQYGNSAFCENKDSSGNLIYYGVDRQSPSCNFSINGSDLSDYRYYNDPYRFRYANSLTVNVTCTDNVDSYGNSTGGVASGIAKCLLNNDTTLSKTFYRYNGYNYVTCKAVDKVGNESTKQLNLQQFWWY